MVLISSLIDIPQKESDLSGLLILIKVEASDRKGFIYLKTVFLKIRWLNSYDLLLSRSGSTVGKSYLHLKEGKYASAGYLVRFNFA